jgi:uncharacterized protein YfiM (DUF2279 family)
LIQQDKIKHFIAGTITSAFVYAITGSPILAFGASVILGIGKEIYDSRGHGTVEVLDAVATGLGGIVGVILARVVM